MAKIKGIDLSQWQGDIDFKKVAASGVKFAILREGFRKTIDKKFIEYAKGCQQNGITVMIYHFIYTDNATIQQNAWSTYINLKKANLDPSKVWIASDLEYDTWDKNGEKCTKEKCTLYTKQYLQALKKFGCNKLFIYTNNDYYKNYYDWQQLNNYPVWLADLSNTLNENNIQQKYPHTVLHQYSWTGQVPGINANVDMDWLYNADMLTKDTITFKKSTAANKAVTAQDVLKVMSSWVGMSRANMTHKPIIDTYNSYSPKARNYTVTYQDEYCDTTISAAFIKLNAVNLIGGTECGVEKHVQIFKNFGIWEQNGTITPQPGYLIVYNWNDNTQPNDGYSDHIGIVESVSNGKITTIEGNMAGGVVGRRTIPIGWGYIRGYAKPKYAVSASQPIVTSEIDYAQSYDKNLIRTFTTTSALNMRAGAGKDKKVITVIPNNATVSCYGYYTDKWYFVQYKDFTGFCSSAYLK